MSTTPTNFSTGLTFEQVWAMFQETDKKFKETDRKFQETDRRFQETDKKFQETDRKFHETDKKFQETDRKFHETDKKFQETDRKIAKIIEENAERSRKEKDEFYKKIKEINDTIDKNTKERQEAAKRLDEQIEKVSRSIGELGNRFGELAEHLVAPGVAERFNELGYHFDGVAKGGLEISENGRVVTEVDILLENEKTIAVIEVKTRPTVHDVKRQLKQMEIVRRYYERHWNTCKTIIGAIAGAVFPVAAKDAAINAGFYVITQSGDTVKIEVPPNFKPREF